MHARFNKFSFIRPTLICKQKLCCRKIYKTYLFSAGKMEEKLKIGEKKLNELSSTVEILKKENQELKKRMSTLETKVESIISGTPENNFQLR